MTHRRPRVGVAIPEAELIALRQRLLRWYATNGRDLPWRRTTDPYAILISETMLQQTQVSRVLAKYGEWLAVFPSLDRLARAPLRDVLLLWQGLGYNNRARRLHDTAVAVASPAGTGTLPAALDALLALPGIGPYTARAILVFAHNCDVAAIDTNVRRVLIHELDLDPDIKPQDLRLVAEAALPHGCSREWHNALMDYGALELTARRTGLAPTSRQGRFAGSRRQYRGRCLRVILARQRLTLSELAAELALPESDVALLLALLEDDGLVVRHAHHVAIA